MAFLVECLSKHETPETRVRRIGVYQTREEAIAAAQQVVGDLGGKSPGARPTREGDSTLQGILRAILRVERTLLRLERKRFAGPVVNRRSIDPKPRSFFEFFFVWQQK